MYEGCTEGNSCSVKKWKGNQLPHSALLQVISLFSSRFFNPLNPCEVSFPSERVSPGCSLLLCSQFLFLQILTIHSPPPPTQAGSERLGSSIPCSSYVSSSTYCSPKTLALRMCPGRCCTNSQFADEDNQLQGLSLLYPSYLLLSQPRHTEIAIQSMLSFVTWQKHWRKGLRSPGIPRTPSEPTLGPWPWGKFSGFCHSSFPLIELLHSVRLKMTLNSWKPTFLVLTISYFLWICCWYISASFYSFAVHIIKYKRVNILKFGFTLPS